MNDRSQSLSREELLALKFAAHRQLARWGKNRPLATHQQTRRDALARAVQKLEDPALASGCELRVGDR